MKPSLSVKEYGWAPAIHEFLGEVAMLCSGDNVNGHSTPFLLQLLHRFCPLPHDVLFRSLDQRLRRPRNLLEGIILDC